MISLVLPTASLVAGDGQSYNFIEGMVGPVTKVGDGELTFFFCPMKICIPKSVGFFGTPKDMEAPYGKLPILFP